LSGPHGRDMGGRSSILAVKHSRIVEHWTELALDEVRRMAPRGRLAALCGVLVEKGADVKAPLAAVVARRNPAEARAVFEALCETLAEGVWDVPGWVIRPHVDVEDLLGKGAEPYPAGLEPDGRSIPELCVWLDGARDSAALEEARKRLLDDADGSSRGDDPDLARAVCEHLAALLCDARSGRLLVLIEHPEGAMDR
jgi:hypothetical protein